MIVVALAIAPAPRHSLAFVIATGVLAFAVVVALWTVTHAAITIAHEGGHALTASAVGGAVLAIIIEGKGHGSTHSRLSGPGGRFLTAMAGYLGPPIFGLAGAILLSVGRVRGMLWLSLFFLVCALAMSRGWFSRLTIIVTGVLVYWVVRYAGPTALEVFAYTWVWFLLIGGLRSVAELSRERRMFTDTSSDAYQLRQLTMLPSALWVGFFGLCGMAALVTGAFILSGSI
jgi:Peptidase M50B-like